MPERVVRVHARRALLCCAAALSIGASGPALATLHAAAREAARELLFDRAKGNCLACHRLPTLVGAEQPGDSGPPLIAMQARFSDKRVLRAKIWDATASTPDSFMPPFGRHQILTADEIDLVVEFIYGL